MTSQRKFTWIEIESAVNRIPLRRFEAAANFGFSAEDGWRAVREQTARDLERELSTPTQPVPAESPDIERLQAELELAHAHADDLRQQMQMWRTQCGELGEELAKVKGCGVPDEKPDAVRV